MDTNKATMDALFQTFNAKFNAAMAPADERVNANDLLVEDVAMLVPSGGAATNHAWLNQLPSMKEWAGDRVINTLELGLLTVVNRPFESTVEVPRNAIEDDAYGVYAQLIASMGAAAAKLWLQLTVGAMVANDLWADGNKFFCSGRKFGRNTVTNASKAALSQSAVEAAMATMRGWQLNGDQTAGVRPVVLVVGPALESLAKRICEATLISDGTTSVSNTSPAINLKVRVAEDLVGTHEKSWFIVGEKNGIKAVCVQKRKEPVLTRLDKDTDANVFNGNKFLYGTDARGEAFMTLPFLAYMGNPDKDVTAWVDPDAASGGGTGGE